MAPLRTDRGPGRAETPVRFASLHNIALYFAKDFAHQMCPLPGPRAETAAGHWEAERVGFRPLADKNTEDTNSVLNWD
jgi:hypothetical protein